MFGPFPWEAAANGSKGFHAYVLAVGIRRALEVRFWTSTVLSGSLPSPRAGKKPGRRDRGIWLLRDNYSDGSDVRTLYLALNLYYTHRPLSGGVLSVNAP